MIKKIIFSLIVSIIILLSISFVDLYCTHTSFKIFNTWLVEFNGINNYSIFINSLITNLAIVFIIVFIIMHFIKLNNYLIYISLFLLCISVSNFFMKTSINLTIDTRKEVPSNILIDKSLAILLKHKKIECEN